jgi:predicted DNA binding CopG/RHH family protein
MRAIAMKKHKTSNVTLAQEEKDLLDSIERGEWHSVSNLEEETNLAKKAAENFLRKTSALLYEFQVMI